jgi:glycosyltransferase involved in cell wall biosynthesis
MKKLLVVLTTYNREKYVERAINSILNQTYKNFDLVIVDDCSTDKTLSVIKKYESDPRVTIISNSLNAGCFYSKNTGIKFMDSGIYDVFTTHDSDDFSDSTRFEKMMRLFDKENVLCAFSSEMRIGNNTPEWYGDSIRTISHHAFFSKKAFKFFGYFDNALTSADIDYFFRVKAFCNIFSFFKYEAIDDLLYYADTTANDNMLIMYDEEMRMKYDAQSRVEIEDMIKNRNFYRPFFEITESLKNKK